jgi:hypothetical protein
VIRVKVSQAGKQDLLKQLTAGAAKFVPIGNGGDQYLEFTLPIDRADQKHAHTQIQVAWGKVPEWNDGLSEVSTDEKKAMA